MALNNIESICTRTYGRYTIPYMGSYIMDSANMHVYGHSSSEWIILLPFQTGKLKSAFH